MHSISGFSVKNFLMSLARGASSPVMCVETGMRVRVGLQYILRDRERERD